MKRFNKTTVAIAALATMVLLAGCKAQGDGSLSDGLDNNGDTVLFPNDGTTSPATTTITVGGTALTGNFVCDAGIQAFTTDATTEVAANGLVGGPLTTLLNLIGGSSVTTLLNSVTEPDNVIDNDLSTFATFTLTLGLLSAVDSVQELVHANKTISSGNYAVFAVRFPKAVLEASLINQIAVTTYLNDTAQETVTTNQSALDLLGLGQDGRLFIGVQATKAFDTASISLKPNVLSANVGDAMYVHELCTKGHFVMP